MSHTPASQFTEDLRGELAKEQSKIDSPDRHRAERKLGGWAEALTPQVNCMAVRNAVRSSVAAGLLEDQSLHRAAVIPRR